jgi:hypothetical protein
MLPGNLAAHAGRFHAVCFYSDAPRLALIVAEFINEGLLAGQPAVIIATPGHITAIETVLRGNGKNLEHLKHDGAFTAVDAAKTLEGFMVNGKPDTTLFRELMRPLLRRAGKSGSASVLRVYGDMVGLLGQSRQLGAAITLEQFWNVLAATKALSLLCGYSTGDCGGTAINDICGQHTHVLTDAGFAAGGLA